ncbi:MAG: LicD family protein [Lachnospiraceae bacterium]|nr:LicD family protein [Lachnospiraceae bacterium]
MNEMNHEKLNALLNLQLPDRFFRDEVRDGFYVPEMMKRYWAAQLRVLSEVARVCARHDIPWFLDCGTLLGAVRHGGFIPWDDDLDISMLREDADRFLEVAAAELPEGYQVITARTHPTWTHAMPRVVNRDHISLDPEKCRESFGCPYVAGIDIFPQDGLPESVEERDAQKQTLHHISWLINWIGEGNLHTPQCQELLRTVERETHTVLRPEAWQTGGSLTEGSRTEGSQTGADQERLSQAAALQRRLRLLAEEVHRQVPPADACEVTLMPVWTVNNNRRYPRDCFAPGAFLEFEGIPMPVPLDPGTVLTAEYGEWQIPRRRKGVHDYPVYERFEQTLKEHFGENPFHYRMEGKTPQPARETDALRQLREGLRLMARTQPEALAASLPGLLGTLLKGKEIVFLISCAEHLQAVIPLYRAVRDLGADAVLLNLPYYDGGADVSFKDLTDERASYPADLPIQPVQSYPFGSHLPDYLVMTIPYDNWGSLRVPNYFFSENLREQCRHLVYLPGLVPGAPEDEKDVQWKSLREYFEQPALLNADYVLLQDAEMREVTLRILTEAGGPETCDVWENKLLNGQIFFSEK